MLDTSNTPSSQEDWKGILYSWGGPLPSKVERVDVKITDDKKHMVMLWQNKINSVTSAGT